MANVLLNAPTTFGQLGAGRPGPGAGGPPPDALPPGGRAGGGPSGGRGEHTGPPSRIKASARRWDHFTSKSIVSPYIRPVARSLTIKPQT